MFKHLVKQGVVSLDKFSPCVTMFLGLTRDCCEMIHEKYSVAVHAFTVEQQGLDWRFVGEMIVSIEGQNCVIF